MKSKVPLLVICGSTASGKTKLSVDLARALNGEVVSADSMQIYAGMPIGTAQPTPEETQGVPHHLVAFLQPEEPFSVAQYVKLAAATIGEMTQRGKLPLLVGGTGLYVHSLIDNIQLPEMPADSALREELTRFAEQNGPQALWERLHACDPALAATLHPNDRGRIARAIEVYHLTGVPMSVWQQKSREQPSEYSLCMLGLAFRDRQNLYDRINLRVEQMIAQGLVEEARRFFAEHTPETAAQAIGYKELRGYLQGTAPLQICTERIQQETRRYAKRQMTWLRRDSRIRWLFWEDYEDYPALLREALGCVRFE
jgi:tRNA dimethylallyltransferase